MTNFTQSAKGILLTKRFEGLKLSAYKDQVGVWTIGYGHTGRGVHAGLTITQDQADTFLASDVAGAVACVNRLVTSGSIRTSSMRWWILFSTSDAPAWQVRRC